MAGPITWHNVNGPSIAAASVPMAQAGRSFNEGFNALQNVLSQRQQAATNMEDKAKAQNLESFYAAADQYGSREEFEAAQKAGALQSILAPFGQNIDQSKVRQYMDARPNTLDTRATQALQRQDAERERTEAPIRDQAAILIAQGKTGEATALLDQYELRSEAPLHAAVAQEGRAIEDRNIKALDRAYTLDRRGVTDAATDRKTEQDIAAHDAWKVAQHEEKTVNDLALNTLKSHHQKQAEANAAIKEYSAYMKFPTLPNGLPDTANMSDASLAEMEGWLANAPVAQLPSTTQLVDQTKRDGLALGISLKAANQAEALINSNLTSTTPLSMDDQANLDTFTKQVTERTNAQKASNPFYVDPNEGLKAQEAIFARINDRVEDGNLAKANIKDKAATWMNEGMEINGEMVKIPPKVIAMAFEMGLESDTAVFNQTDTYMKNAIEGLMTGEAQAAQREEADYLMSNGDQTAIRNYGAKIRANSGAASGSENVAMLMREIESRKRKSK